MKLAIPVLIFFTSLNLFLFNLNIPAHRYFDEVRYVSAANQIRLQGVNENWSHPPLAKSLIALGLVALGDNALGWRLPSALAGALTLVGIYLLGLTLFQNISLALLATVLAILNQLHFLHSRMATLDVFMVLFLVFGFYFWSLVLFKGGRTLTLSVICFALAGSCKWFGFLPLVLLFFLPRGENSKNILLSGAKALGASLGIYLLSHLVLLRMSHPRSSSTYSALDVLLMQFKTFMAQLNFNNSQHAFQSPWYGWPLGVKTMWLDQQIFRINDQPWSSTVYYAGNLPVLVVGFAAALAVAVHAYRTRSLVSQFLSLSYFWLWLSWILIPRQTAFFYYYYPAAMMLPVITVYAFKIYRVKRVVVGAFVAISAGVFMWNFPYLTARLLPM